MKKHSKWNRWWIAITITVITLIVIITYLYDTNRLGLLFRFEWKSLWTSFKIWEKATLIIGTFVYPIFVNLFSSWLDNHIFPSDTKKIIMEVKKSQGQNERILDGQKKTDTKIDEILKIVKGEIKTDQKTFAEEAKGTIFEGMTVEQASAKYKKMEEDIKKLSVGDKKLEVAIDTFVGELKYKEAKELIDNSLQKHNKDAAVLHYKKGLIYEAEINYSEAKRELETAVVLDRTNPEISGQYGVILYRTSEYDKAIEYYEKALKILWKMYPNGHPHIDVIEANLESAKQAKNK